MAADLYHYLCEVVGPEEVVKSRRLFINILNCMINDHGMFSIIISGSKAEGLDMAGSDVDLMYVLNNYPVHVFKAEVSTSSILIADTENAAPGFAVLRILSEGSIDHLADCTNEGRVLSNVKFKEFLRLHLTHGLYPLHGPCITSYKEDFDYAFCLRSTNWPQVANLWIHRPRDSGWPSKELILEIVQEGVIFVPIGSKFGSTKDNPHEWRLSFSVAEKILIYSFNHIQLLCYAMLKLLLREVVQTKRNIKSSLCSYYMKTVLFWVMEELDVRKWIPTNLLRCFRLCLKRLLYFIKYAVCPNYFVPENNMFEGRLSGIVQKQLFQCIEFLYINGINMFTQSESLSGFLAYKKQDLATSFKVQDEFVDRGVYPLLYITSIIWNNSVHYISQKRINDIMKSLSSKIEKQYFVIVLSIICQYHSVNKTYNFNNCNKMLYSQFRYCQSLQLIGTNIGVSGWILLATLLYQHKQYHNALTVLDHVLLQCSPDKILVGVYQEVKSHETSFQGFRVPFVQRFKLSCIYQTGCFTSKNSYLHATDLGIYCCFMSVINLLKFRILSGNFPAVVNIMLHQIQMLLEDQFRRKYADFMCPTSVAFCYFARFMCFYHLDYTAERQQALRDLHLTVKENYFLEGPEIKYFVLYYLHQALVLSKCYREASNLFDSLQEEYPKCWFKQKMLNGIPVMLKDILSSLNP